MFFVSRGKLLQKGSDMLFAVLGLGFLVDFLGLELTLKEFVESIDLDLLI